MRREGNRLVASLWNEYADETVERVVDHVVVEHGTLPADELYHALKDGSRNGGAVDVEGLARGAPDEIVTNQAGAYLLYRVGDAVSSRNVHAAIYDALQALQGPLSTPGGSRGDLRHPRPLCRHRPARSGLVSSSMAVTGRCAFVQAQVGAVVVQSMADPRLGPAALKLLPTAIARMPSCVRSTGRRRASTTVRWP